MLYNKLNTFSNLN